METILINYSCECVLGNCSIDVCLRGAWCASFVERHDRRNKNMLPKYTEYIYLSLDILDNRDVARLETPSVFSIERMCVVKTW